jgi:hypothetical protein
MSSYPPDPDQPPDYPPRSYDPVPPEHDPYAAPPSAISARVTPAAVGLLVVAIINALLGLGLGFIGAAYTQMPPAQLEDQMERQNPKQFNDIKQMGWSGKTIIDVCIYGGLGGGCVSIFISLLVIIGAIRMMMMRSHGLAVFAAILTAIPCISPSACCLIGEGVGIWALVVLLNADVRAAFR